MKRLILLLFASSAQAAQLYYTPVTVDHTKVPSTQTNFAVLVSQTDTRFKTTGGHVNNANGYDIRPYSDTGLTSALTYELERYNASTGEVVMWVLVPSLSSSSDYVIYLGYGDTALTTNGSSTSTWNSNYVGVWHLKDGTTLALTDSTATANTLVNTATVAATSGKVDGGAGSFDGTSQALSTTNTMDLTAANQITVSMWANFASFGNLDKLMGEFTTNFNTAGGILIDPDDSASSQFSLSVKSNVTAAYNGGHFTRPAAGMHYYVFTFDLTTGTALDPAAWVDGVSQTMTQDTSGSMLGDFFSNARWYFMSRAATSLFHAATALDEIRISKVLRAQDWITAEYNNQNNPGTFETLGTEVNLAPATPNSAFLFFFP